jgi:RNA polymerase sigma factor (sigma-70 family)
MSELSLPAERPKKDWTLNPRALDRLLIWLDDGTDSSGQRYLEMRRRLVSYFDRKNCLTPDDLADETLNRVARRLDEEGVIESETPARYCYIIARFVFMEYLRNTRKADQSLDESRRASFGVSAAPGTEDEQRAKEKMLNCLEKCTSELEPRSREIITRYYVDKGRRKIENRQGLAKELGITMNALSIRACRIRDKLETCVRECTRVE